MADELAGLVVTGKKFGTASAYDAYVIEAELDELPKVGDYSRILRDNGEAVCVIRNYEVYLRPFGQVSPFHAYSEGEGDRTLEYWKRVHTNFFEPFLTEGGHPLTEDSMIVCEKFNVEYAPGEEKDQDLFFAEPSETFRDEIAAFRREMLEADSDFSGCYCLKRMENPSDFIYHCTNWSNPALPTNAKGARGQVLLAIRKSDGRMVGSLQAHYVLSERMAKFTGQVGYAVRPSERRKGYAKKMLAKAADFLSTFGYREIYVSCEPENEGSRRTILANGGEYVEQVYLEEDGVYLERYRIRK